MLVRIPITPPARHTPSHLVRSCFSRPWIGSCLISPASGLLPFDRLHLGRSRACQEPFSRTFADDRNDQPSPPILQIISAVTFNGRRFRLSHQNGLSPCSYNGTLKYLGFFGNECHSGFLKSTFYHLPCYKLYSGTMQIIITVSTRMYCNTCHNGRACPLQQNPATALLFLSFSRVFCFGLVAASEWV